MPGFPPFGSVPLFVGSGGVLSLFVLHHLRSRPQTRWVETLIFWDLADEQPVASRLWSRQFRHRKTWMLLSAIVLLFAAALGLENFDRTDAKQSVTIVVDAGLEMTDPATGKLLSAARSKVADQAVNSGAATVIAAADQPRVVVSVSEPAAIAGRRLSELAPAQTASASALALQLAASIQGKGAGPIDWYSNQPSIPVDVPPLIASRVRRHFVAPDLRRWAMDGVEFVPSTENLSTGSLRVSVTGAPDLELSAAMSRGNGPVIESAVKFDKAGANISTGHAQFDDLPADGRPIRILVRRADGNGISESVDYTMPHRAGLRFFGKQNATPPLRDALSAIGQWTADPRGAIAVIHDGEVIPSGAMGAIALTPPGKTAGQSDLTAAAFLVTSGLGFEDVKIAVDDAALPGGNPVVMAGGKAVLTLDAAGTVPIVRISQSAVDSDARLPRLAAFPILMRRLCDALAGEVPGSPVIASSRQVRDPVWRDSQSPRVIPTTVNELAPNTGGSENAPSAPAARPSLDLVELALLTAVVLLFTEEILLAKKKIV